MKVGEKRGILPFLGLARSRTGGHNKDKLIRATRKNGGQRSRGGETGPAGVWFGRPREEGGNKERKMEEGQKGDSQKKRLLGGKKN